MRIYPCSPHIFNNVEDMRRKKPSLTEQLSASRIPPCVWIIPIIPWMALLIAKEKPHLDHNVDICHFVTPPPSLTRVLALSGMMLVMFIWEEKLIRCKVGFLRLWVSSSASNWQIIDVTMRSLQLLKQNLTIGVMHSSLLWWGPRATAMGHLH